MGRPVGFSQVTSMDKCRMVILTHRLESPGVCWIRAASRIAEITIHPATNYIDLRATRMARIKARLAYSLAKSRNAETHHAGCPQPVDFKRRAAAEADIFGGRVNN